MRQNSTITVMNMKRQLEGVYFTMKYKLHETINYTNMDIVYKYFTQSCSAEFLKTHTIYYKLFGGLHTIMFYDIILSWLTCGQSQKMKRMP